MIVLQILLIPLVLLLLLGAFVLIASEDVSMKATSRLNEPTVSPVDESTLFQAACSMEYGALIQKIEADQKSLLGEHRIL